MLGSLTWCSMFMYAQLVFDDVLETSFSVCSLFLAPPYAPACCFEKRDTVLPLASRYASACPLEKRQIAGLQRQSFYCPDFTVGCMSATKKGATDFGRNGFTSCGVSFLKAFGVLIFLRLVQQVGSNDSIAYYAI